MEKINILFIFAVVLAFWMIDFPHQKVLIDRATCFQHGNS
jgi:hypothetical protein